MRRLLWVFLFVFTGFFLSACSGAGRSNTAPPQISVTISPTSASVATGQTQQFTATVTGSSNTGVTWRANGVTGGNSTAGTISTSGLYIAPNAVPNPASVTITAISQADSSKSFSASATITPQANVTVAPNPATVEVFASQQFTATVNGQPSTAVTWQVNGVAGGSTPTGTISSTGLYNAPHSVPTTSTGSQSVTTTVTVTAVPQASPSSSGSAAVTVFAPNQTRQVGLIKLGTTGGNAKDSSTSGTTITCCGGTLGALVSRGGNQYILSNNHVLARSDLATPSDNIIQPGLVDANCSTGGTTVVAQLSQFFNLETGSPPKVDAALAQVFTGTVDLQGSILELGGTNSGGMPTDGPPHAGSGVAATLNRPVAKSGRSTGLTCSTVLATSVATSVQYQKGCGTGSTFTVNYTNQVLVAGGSFSAAGDSGSLIVTQDTADPVALLYGGSDTDTVGNPISDVLTALADPANPSVKPAFVGASATHPVAACSLPGPQAAMATRLALQKVAPSSDAISRAVAVRDLHAPELMAHPEVQALGVGASLDHPGEPAILFFVAKGQPHTNLPAEVDGIRTRIVEGELFARLGVLSAADSAALEQAAAPAPLVTFLSDAEVARARGVHAQHVEELMQQPGVQGVGITSSADSPGEAALMIFLIRGVAHPPIPQQIDGLRTRLRESSRFRAGFADRAPQSPCSFRGAPAHSSKPSGASTKP